MLNESSTSDTFIVPGASPAVSDVLTPNATPAPEPASSAPVFGLPTVQAPQNRDIYSELMAIAKEIERCRASL